MASLAIPVAAQVAPDLGTAAPYTVLGTNGVPTSGTVTCATSTVNGDVGTTGNSITNTGCAITGTIDAPVAASVVTDFDTAFNAVDAANPSCDGVIPIVSTTLPPGVYCSAAGTTIGAGVTLTLDGDAGDTWVFRVGTGGLGALTLTDAQVVMAGTADACNVFWKTAEAATLTGSDFVGTILSGATISMTGGSWRGRAMATTDVAISSAAPLVFAGCAAPAAITVSKNFSDDNPAAVSVNLSCSSGVVSATPLNAAEGSPAVFTVSLANLAGATCAATETVPVGYSADQSNCVAVALNGNCTITNTLIPQVIALTLVKSSNEPQPVNVANATSTSYIMTVFNNGDTATSGDIVIHDHLREGLLLTSFSGTGWNCTGTGTRNVECIYTGTPLAGDGGSTILNITVSIDQFTIDANNTGRVSGGGDPTCPAPPLAAADRCSSTVIIGTVPVSLSFVKTSVNGGTVNLEFTTLAEVGTAGFRVLSGRLGERSGRRLSAILPSRGSSLAPQDYLFQFDFRDETGIWIEEVMNDGKSTLYGPYPLGLEVGQRVVADVIDWTAINSELIADQTAQNAQIRSRAAGAGLEAEIAVAASGLVRVSHADLVIQGLDWSGLDPRNMNLTQGTRQIPIAYTGPALVGPGSLFTFFAEAISDSLYTRTSVYRLRVDGQRSTPMQTVHANPAALQPALAIRDWYNHAPNFEYDLSARATDPYSAFRVYRSNLSTAAHVESFSLPNLQTSIDADRIAVDLWSDYAFPHSIRFLLNGTVAGTMRFSGRDFRTFETPVAPGVLLNGNNSLRVELVADTGQELDSINVEAIRINYTRRLIAPDNKLSFSISTDPEIPQSGDSIFGDNFNDEGMLACTPDAACASYTVTGLTTSAVVVMRQRNDLVEQLVATRISGSGSAYELVFASSRVDGDRYWIEPAAGRDPASVAPAPPITDPLDGLNAQLLIISHGSFIDGLGGFVAARQSEGLTVRVADVKDIYRFYGSGEVDPMSIDIAIQFAEQRLGTRYVLLVGGDTRDYFNFSGSNSVSFIPTHYREVGDLVTFAPTDAPFGDTDLDGRMNVAIGRWPVRTSAELDFVIQKTLAYAQADHGRKTLLVSDRNQQGVQFGQQLTLVPSALGATWTDSEIRLEDYPIGGTEGARAAMVAAVNAGQALTVYMGHGAPLAWTQEGLITSQMLSGGMFSNSSRPTATWALGCYGTYFTQPQYNSVSHGWLTRNGTGAAAVFGASTLTDISSDIAWLNALGPLLRGERLGDALLQAQNRLHDDGDEYRDVWLGVSLMGDPTLRVREGL